MGTNKRYAAAIDRRLDGKILEHIARDAGPLQSLSREEIGMDTEPVTIDPKPKPVRAWVRFGATPVWVDGQACRWTADAVAIRFLVGDAGPRSTVAEALPQDRGAARLGPCCPPADRERGTPPFS